MLVAVHHDTDDQAVEILGSALDDIQMPVCDGVKAAGVNRCFHTTSEKLCFSIQCHRRLAVSIVAVVQEAGKIAKKLLFGGPLTDDYTTIR